MKVCSVSYLNSIPFVFGLENKSIGVDLSLDIPSRCAEKLQQDEVDLALVPVAIIPSLESPSIVSPFCISSDGAVQTVCLFSEVPLDQIDTMISTAVISAERYYPAFQLVTWGEQSLKSAMQVAIAEACGRA